MRSPSGARAGLARGSDSWHTLPYLTFTLPCLHQEYVVMVEGAIASTLEELECKADEIDRWTDRESRGLS